MVYCKTLNKCGIKNLRFIENDKLAHYNFGVHDKRWLKILGKFDVTVFFVLFFSKFSIKLYIVASFKIASSRRF